MSTKLVSNHSKNVRIKVQKVTTEQELNSVGKLRYQIFVNELGMKPTEEELKTGVILDDLDRSGIVLAAYKDSEMVASCRLNVDDHQNSPYRKLYSLDNMESIFQRIGIVSKFAVLTEYRGSDPYKALVNFLFEVGEEHNLQVALLGCAPHLARLYERLGFKTYKRPQAVDRYGYIVPMALELLEFKKPFPERNYQIKEMKMKVVDVVKAKWQEFFMEDASKSIAIKKLSGGTLTKNEYCSILREIYHQVKEHPQAFGASTVRLRGIAREVVGKMLRHAASENGHHKLALNDLKTLGYDISTVPYERPLPETTATLGHMYQLINYDNPISFLGYLFHLEFLPTAFGQGYASGLSECGIPSNAMSFLLDHAEIDVHHNKMMEEYLEMVVQSDSDLEDLLYSIKTTSRLYMNMLDAAVENAEVAERGINYSEGVNKTLAKKMIKRGISLAGDDEPKEHIKPLPKEKSTVV